MSNKPNVRFAAINKRVQRNIILPTETTYSGAKYVQWGEDNKYPDFLLFLYRNCTTLHSVISGAVDYVCGDSIESSVLPNGRINQNGESKEDFVEILARDYFTFGGFAIEVIRDREGDVSEVSALPLHNLRSDKNNEAFYYSEKWEKSGTKYEVLPKFVPEHRNNARSVYLYKNSTYSTYPEPIYAASVKACNIECDIDDYHLNAIENGFAGSVIVNFNNGQPEDAIMDEIEKNFNAKFSGSENAGRIALCWNENRASATTIDKLPVDDFGDRYAALSKHSRQQIFTAFRANPNLFGIPTESLGFSEEEYKSAFKLFNRTIVRPAQKRICNALDEIYGIEGVLTIRPFSLEEESEKTVE